MIRELMKRLTTKFALVLCSIAIGLVLCEFSYRIYLNHLLRTSYIAGQARTGSLFSAIDRPPWRYDRAVGYDFEPNTPYTFAVVREGIFVGCSNRHAING